MRLHLMTAALSLGLLVGGCQAQAPKSENWLLTGTYSAEANKGVQLLRYDTSSDSFTLVKTFAEVENASFGVFDAENRRLYVTDERDAGRIAAYNVAKGDMALSAINSADSMAGAPCYLALSPDKTRLAVANYHGDVVALYAIDPSTGAITGEPQILRSTGDKATGHAHWVQWSPDGAFIYVVDLGFNEVRAYAYDAKTGVAGAPVTAFKAPEKAGPRHMAFSKTAPYAFVLTEYSNQLIGLKRNADGTLTELQSVSTLPADFTGKSFGAHIIVNAAGDRVYVSNRGHNSLAIFAIAADGRLSHLQTISTGGDWPRFFNLMEDDRRLLVAHQNDHVITVFHVNPDGTLMATDKRFTSHMPVLIEGVTP